MSSEEAMRDSPISPLESPICSPTPEDDHNCPSCSEKMKQPTVLSCLHVFCMTCLQKQLEENSTDGKESRSIECKKCKLETQLTSKGLLDLTPEYVLMDLMEMSDIELMQIICTSCKAKEKAVARCQDCANYLCPNCVTAHQFMRCFDNHKVISIEDLKKGDASAIHRPIFCSTHPSELLKHYCKTCEMSICNGCIVGDHKSTDHQTEKIEDLEEGERESLHTVVSSVKDKIRECEETSSTLTNSFGELQSQRDNAKDLINETFQSYKAYLEKIRDEMLTELDSIQSTKELALMDLCHNVEKAVEKLEDGCKFAEHVLNNGSGLQLLLMKKVIISQLMSLLSTIPKSEVDVHIEFNTNAEEFEKAIKKNFGSFKKEEEEETRVPERPLSSLHSSFENEGFHHLQPGILSPDPSTIPPMQPGFMNMMQPSNLPSTSLAELTFPTFSSMPPGAVPISRSRSTVESRSLSRNSHSPAMSDSGISVDAGSTNSNSSAPLVNIAALAKLGTVGYNAQGQVTFNNHIVPGLNMPVIPPVSSRNPTPISEIGMTTTARPQTPQLETLAKLLDRSNSTLDNDMSTFSMSASGAITPNQGSMTPTGVLSDSASSLGTIGSGRDSFMGSSSSDNFMTAGMPPVRRVNKMSAMQIRCKFGQLGPGKGQFNSPHGFCLGLDEDIIVADTNNHRIQLFEKTGEFKYQFGIPGREEGQLWYPRKVAVMRNSGKFIVCDRGNERSRMQIFTKNGHFVKKIAIRYIDIVAGLAITSQGHIVAVDSVSPTVFCIAENGELMKWFDCSDYMREPSDIAISGKEYFVCDFKGHCVVVFNEEGHFQRRIGCENITNYPNGIDISDAGDVLVGDSHGNRFHVAVFQRDGSLIGEFECPYVKVSRCCGLKITSEGYVVTLAKNNHHVLVLNTLYIT